MSTRKFLVTAGNTRERIDRVRDWGNIFTGNTGYAIARALAEWGDVDLLTSNRGHAAEASAATGGRVRASAFTSHGELKGALETLLARERYDAVFMTAAVADYRPAGVFEVVERTAGEGGMETWRVRDVAAPKVKSHHGQIAVLGEQTEKLVDLFRTAWGHEGLLFKFKLEVGIGREDLLRIGRTSRVASGANYLVANTLEMVEGADAGAFLISEVGEEFVPRGALASRLVEVVRKHW
jgi:phosphopantothenoylcysteine decarboxylase/phosphopantothenate--cysteine ligase